MLEVGCGGGVGLGYLGAGARMVVGGDYTYSSLHAARVTYAGRMPLIQLDAHALPFKAHTFDVVLLFETLYYLRDPGAFVDECTRVLRNGGQVVLSSVNKEWRDFNPSPFSTRYFSGSELVSLLEQHGYATRLFGAFSAEYNWRQHAISLIRRLAIRWRLIPKSFKWKAPLKRLVYGPLGTIPAVLDALPSEQTPGVAVTGSSVPVHKILYAIASRR